jgi:hypothetical protein
MTAASDTSLNYRRYSFQHNLFGQERRPSIPFSPPHQSYDPSSQRPPVPNDYPSPYFHPGDPNGTRGMIPSPPPSLFKTDHRRLSLDDAPARRQPADLMSYSRRRSLHNHPSRVPSSEVIHLPPIQTIVSPMQKSPRAEDGIGEVDAAVAMMQLASRRQSKNVL